MYEAKEKGTVEAAGFYVMVPDTEYALYGAVVPGDMEPGEVLSGLGGELMPLLASGRLGEAGFYTIPFEAPVEVKAEAGLPWRCGSGHRERSSRWPLNITAEAGGEMLTLPTGKGILVLMGHSGCGQRKGRPATCV